MRPLIILYLYFPPRISFIHYLLSVFVTPSCLFHEIIVFSWIHYGLKVILFSALILVSLKLCLL